MQVVFCVSSAFNIKKIIKRTWSCTGIHYVTTLRQFWIHQGAQISQSWNLNKIVQCMTLPSRKIVIFNLHYFTGEPKWSNVAWSRLYQCSIRMANIASGTQNKMANSSTIMKFCTCVFFRTFWAIWSEAPQILVGPPRWWTRFSQISFSKLLKEW